MGLLRWGLIPSWSKDPSIASRLINARSETVATKPSFRVAFQRRRCLVPADGFYEWKRDEKGDGGKGTKTPFWIHMATREPFVFAGLWESWQPDDGATLYTYTILTTEASEDVREIHNRMPVILPDPARSQWLDPASDADDLRDLLRPFPSRSLHAHPVSSIVNSPRNDLPECVEPASC